MHHAVRRKPLDSLCTTQRVRILTGLSFRESEEPRVSRVIGKEKVQTHIWKTKMSATSSTKCEGGDLQFLDTILSLVTMAAVDLLLAVQIMLRGRRTLRAVLAFFSNHGL